MQTVSQYIGEAIHYYRTEKKLTQTELAQEVGHSSPSYIAFIEKGERSIKAEDLFLIASALDVSIEYLFPSEF